MFFGLIASGKSTLARAWAARSGWRHHNSDVVRKKLAGISPETPAREALGAGIYSPEFTRRTYDRLLALAEEDLARGRNVILDASYSKKEERDRVRALATRMRAGCRFLLCLCGEEEVARRLVARSLEPGAVSDGRMEIYQAQKKSFEPPDELDSSHLIRFDTEHPLEELLERFARIAGGN